MSGSKTVTLLSDFGMQDGYVAAMKGVILDLAPDAQVVDATHSIAPHDVRAGAWVIGQYWRCYPEGTIHVAVIDPGVGTERAALVVEADRQFFIAPDNGLLTWVLKEAEHVEPRQIRPDVHRPGGVSDTFHGRDIFAYAAGKLAAGSAPSDISTEVESVIMPSWAFVNNKPDVITGEVVHIDHFGNLITNITREHIAEKQWDTCVVCAGLYEDITIVRTYGDADEGEVVALFGSSDTLEVAVNGGSAAKKTGLKRGAKIQVAGAVAEGG